MPNWSVCNRILNVIPRIREEDGVGPYLQMVAIYLIKEQPPKYTERELEVFKTHMPCATPQRISRVIFYLLDILNEQKRCYHGIIMTFILT